MMMCSWNKHRQNPSVGGREKRRASPLIAADTSRNWKTKLIKAKNQMRNERNGWREAREREECPCVILSKNKSSFNNLVHLWKVLVTCMGSFRTHWFRYRSLFLWNHVGNCTDIPLLEDRHNEPHWRMALLGKHSPCPDIAFHWSLPGTDICSCSPRRCTDHRSDTDSAKTYLYETA